MGPTQLAEVLGRLPRQGDERLLVGFETSDDAAVFVMPDGRALVQTMDFFTPIVDDPYDYGQIAAANALSDCYAMGGEPLTVMNIACFDPDLAPAEVWAAVLRGMWDKSVEAGAAVVGGHSVVDREPKFGMSVTGVVEPGREFRNDMGKAGDRLWLSKPLGTGIVATAAKNDAASPEELAAAVASMRALNRDAAKAAARAGVRCATDVTGFGLAGHLSHVVRASGVRAVVQTQGLPAFPGVERLAAAGHTTGGAGRNLAFVEPVSEIAPGIEPWRLDLAFDPQTSGGLLCASPEPVEGFVEVGWLEEGPPGIRLQ